MKRKSSAAESSSDSEDSTMDFTTDANMKSKGFEIVKNAKKSRTESSTDIVELFESMFEIQRNVMRCIMNGEKRTVKEVAEDVQVEKGKISTVFSTLAGMIKTLSERVPELEKTNATQSASYAEKLRSSASVPTAPTVAPVQKPQVPRISGTRQPATKTQTVVKITPPGNGKNSDETKKEVIGLLNPATEKIRIKNVWRVRDNGIVVETQADEDLQKIMDNPELKEKGFTIEKPGKRKTRLIVYDVPKSMSVEELHKAIYDQNEETFEGLEFTQFKEL